MSNWLASASRRTSAFAAVLMFTLGNHSSDDDVAETMALTRLWMEVTRTEEQR